MFSRKLDELNRTLLITGVCSMIAGNLLFQVGTVPRKILSLIAAAALIYAVIRLLAGNPERRANENIRFLAGVTAVKSWFFKVRDRIRDASGSVRDFSRKTAARFHRKGRGKAGTGDQIRYKLLRCPSCRQKLRVPKGKGKIRVTCTHCGTRFDAKS